MNARLATALSHTPSWDTRQDPAGFVGKNMEGRLDQAGIYGKIARVFLKRGCAVQTLCN